MIADFMNGFLGDFLCFLLESDLCQYKKVKDYYTNM
jgi:hypothetical protein